MFGRRGGQDRPAPAWSRQQLLALLIGAGLTALALVAGLVLAIASAVGPTRHRPGSTHTPSTRAAGGAGGRPGGSGPPGERTDPRDRLADAAMPQVGPGAAHPGPVSATPAATLLLPVATAAGPAQVPTGFGHTPAGAMAQLAAIDQAALQSGSLAGARSVITGWAMPGGPSPTSWSVIAGLVTLFDQTGLSGGGSPQLALVATPLMGEIKGTVGPDFVLPCVDFELDITLHQTARGADADCQRMVWNPAPTVAGGALAGRWMIGPGSEPAAAPSIWPDTDTARTVGYRDLRPEPHK